MKVSELKKLLENVDDDTTIVICGPDHSYREIYWVSKTSAVFCERLSYMYEDYNSPLQEGEKRIKVLVIE